MKVTMMTLCGVLVALSACGVEKKKDQDIAKVPAVTAEAQTMADEQTLSTLPTMVLVKVPVQDGVEKTSEAQVVSSQIASIDDDLQAVSAFEAGQSLNVKVSADELDQTSSSQQWCWGGGSSYGGGYGSSYGSSYGGGYGYGSSYGYGGYSPYLYSSGYGYNYGYSNSYYYGGNNYYSYYRPSCGYSRGYGY